MRIGTKGLVVSMLAAWVEVLAGCGAGLDAGRLAVPGPAERGPEIAAAELRAFGERAADLGGTAEAVRRRELGRLRQRLESTRRDALERSDLATARLRATLVAQLETFSASATTAPDRASWALVTLADLYYDEEEARYAVELERFDRELELSERGEGPPPTEPVADFSRTAETARRVLTELPRSREVDRALYVLGHAELRAGRDEAALSAWAALVCSNRFPYRPGPAAPLAFAGDGAPADPWAGCEPVVPSSGLEQETWLRIGEYHFDFDWTPRGLDRAIAAYQRALELGESVYAEVALYKLAWSYYRSDRYPEAVRHFARLVESADEDRQRAVAPDLDLRPEAVQYIAICFAESDWNADTLPDAVTPAARLQDPQLLPQDRPFTPEVYLRTAEVLFDLAQYGDAVEVYRLVTDRWPGSIHDRQAATGIERANGRARGVVEEAPVERPGHSAPRIPLHAQARAYHELHASLAAARRGGLAAAAARWAATAFQDLVLCEERRLAEVDPWRAAVDGLVPGPPPTRAVEAGAAPAGPEALAASLRAYDELLRDSRRTLASFFVLLRELDDSIAELPPGQAAPGELVVTAGPSRRPFVMIQRREREPIHAP
jgi:hypothetical protein